MSKPEDWIEKRTAQALLKGVKPNFIARKIAGFDGQIGMKIGEKLVGGTWMSGTVYLTNDKIIFEPGFLDKMVVQSDSIPSLSIPVADISNTAFRKELVSKILDIESEDLTLSLRGLNLESFQAAILKQMN